MSRNEFEFTTDWTFDGSMEEIGALVAEAAADGSAFVRLWPAAFLHVGLRRPGDGDCVGRVLELRTRGFLPYTLSWEVEVVEARHLQRYVLVSKGDLAGTAIWTLERLPAGVRVRLEWRVRADKPLVRWLAFLLRPLFASNHRWAMARGQESISRELVRRRALAAAGSGRGPVAGRLAVRRVTAALRLPHAERLRRADALGRGRVELAAACAQSGLGARGCPVGLCRRCCAGPGAAWRLLSPARPPAGSPPSRQPARYPKRTL